MKILNLTKNKIDAIINIGSTLISLGNQIKSLLDVNEAEFQEIVEEKLKETEFKVIDITSQREAGALPPLLSKK